jgi:hypothetical protein
LFITAYINENTFDAVNTGLPGTVPNAGITCRRLSEADWWGANLYGKQTGQTEYTPHLTGAYIRFRKELFISLLMTVLSQSFFTLMRRNFMTLPFFTTRHTQIIFNSCL